MFIHIKHKKTAFISLLCVAQLLIGESPIPNAQGLRAQEEIADRIRGSLVAGSLGDAMGAPTEFVSSLSEIYQQFPNGIHSFADFQPKDIVPYTDDTALTLVTAEASMQGIQACVDYGIGGIDRFMGHLVRAYIKDMHAPDGWAKPSRAPGTGCLKNVRYLVSLGYEADNGDTWKAGLHELRDAAKTGKLAGGGCGAVMRAHPFGLLYRRYKNGEVMADFAAQHSLLTHGSLQSMASCAAMATGVAAAVQGKNVPDIIEGMIAAAARYDGITAVLLRNAVALAEKNKKLIEKYDYKKLPIALANGKSKLAQAEQENVHNPVFEKHLGWLAHDAIAATVYIFALYPDDIKRAIYLGVHTPGDSDSIASMAGALVGARVGYKKVEKSYSADIARLEGRERIMQLADKIIAF
jgi:ADP-ribosylglycohydrolase